jgi:hypothetical protein
LDEAYQYYKDKDESTLSNREQRFRQLLMYVNEEEGQQEKQHEEK